MKFTLRRFSPVILIVFGMLVPLNAASGDAPSSRLARAWHDVSQGVADMSRACAIGLEQGREQAHKIIYAELLRDCPPCDPQPTPEDFEFVRSTAEEARRRLYSVGYQTAPLEHIVWTEAVNYNASVCNLPRSWDLGKLKPYLIAATALVACGKRRLALAPVAVALCDPRISRVDRDAKNLVINPHRCAGYSQDNWLALLTHEFAHTTQSASLLERMTVKVQPRCLQRLKEYDADLKAARALGADKVIGWLQADTCPHEAYRMKLSECVTCTGVQSMSHYNQFLTLAVARDELADSMPPEDITREMIEEAAQRESVKQKVREKFVRAFLGDTIFNSHPSTADRIKRLQELQNNEQ